MTRHPATQALIAETRAVAMPGDAGRPKVAHTPRLTLIGEPMTLHFDRWTVLGTSARVGETRAWTYRPGVDQKLLHKQSEAGVLILMQRHLADGVTELVGALRRPRTLGIGGRR